MLITSAVPLPAQARGIAEATLAIIDGNQGPGTDAEESWLAASPKGVNVLLSGSSPDQISGLAKLRTRAESHLSLSKTSSPSRHVPRAALFQQVLNSSPPVDR